MPPAMEPISDRSLDKRHPRVEEINWDFLQSAGNYCEAKCIADGINL